MSQRRGRVVSHGGRDEERLRPFQKEAKVLASLNRSNIASIYGLEQSDDTHYLVLEVVPGEKSCRKPY